MRENLCLSESVSHQCNIKLDNFSNGGSIHSIEGPLAITNAIKRTNVNSKHGRKAGKHDKELATASIGKCSAR